MLETGNILTKQDQCLIGDWIDICVPVATCYVVVTWFGFLCSRVSPSYVNCFMRLWRKVQYVEVKPPN